MAVRQIKNPEVHYGSEMNEMPKFEDDLDEHRIQMVAAFLRQQRFAQTDFEGSSRRGRKRRPNRIVSGRVLPCSCCAGRSREGEGFGTPLRASERQPFSA